MRINIELAAFFIGIYNKNKESKTCLEFLVDAGVPKKILLDTYKDFLAQEALMPVELLIKEKQRELVGKCRETGLKFNNERLADAARILYTINFINQNT